MRPAAAPFIVVKFPTTIIRLSGVTTMLRGWALALGSHVGSTRPVVALIAASRVRVWGPWPPSPMTEVNVPPM